jgi:hypothetical protein
MAVVFSDFLWAKKNYIKPKNTVVFGIKTLNAETYITLRLKIKKKSIGKVRIT